MKTITKEYQLYKFEELDQKAKDKAREAFNRDNEACPFLEDNLREYIREELEENNIKVLGVATSAKPTINVYYSLTNSQGDGVIFEGTFEWKQYTIYIKHGSSRYYHSNTAVIEMQETENLGFHMDDEHKDVIEFNRIYQIICKTVEKRGYDEIEYQNSEECMQSACDSNDYTFLKDGTMFNE